MGHDESFTEKLGDLPDDSQADGLVDELGARAQAEAEGRADKPGDPTPEDMQRLREAEGR
ncbi:MAG: hypothetical protein M3Q48_14900 [Actinomycetota bacterium]|nr:hypothetical protein [Actinomycetota bacterium]